MQQNSEIKQDELQEALRLLYSNVITSTLVSAFVSTVFVFGLSFGNQGIDNDKVIWWSIMTLGLLFRLFDYFSYRKKAAQQYTPTEKDLWRFFSLSLLVAIMWGAYPLYFFPFANSSELIATVITICGIASGVANMWSAHKVTAISCVLVMSAPYSVLLLLSDDPYEQLIGIMGAAYAIAMSLSGSKFSDFTHKAIHLKNQNAQLLHQMEKKVEDRTQEIYRLSNVDRLTGLLNRTAFLKELNQTVSKNTATQFALLFIDLDGFKQVNDSLGHETGDKVIQETASRIAILSQGPLPICRWGGDEFLIAYQFSNLEEVDFFAQQVIHSISLPHFISQSKAWVGASIGIALYPKDGTHYDTLIQNADMAMYQQKRLEKGKVSYFDESLRQHLIRERLLSDRLYTAIEEGALRLVFQPIIRSDTGNIAGLEALLRWNMDGEDISPIEFIPIAEQYGMIKNLGLWVVEEACQQIIALSKSGNHLTVSINVSIIQLQDQEFVSYIKTLIHKLSFDPKRLHIEMTESVFAADKSLLMTQIKALQELNIGISIDDFGTGYSSLSCMQDLGVNIVKIDKSFIDKIDGNGRSIVYAVVQIAQSMDYRVVAEGVESIEQVNILNDIGVHFLQGYYFSKPLEIDQLNLYLAQHD